MYHERLQQYSCDYCERMIPRSEPFTVVTDDLGDIKHFCRPTDHSDCQKAYEIELVADLGGMYD